MSMSGALLLITPALVLLLGVYLYPLAQLLLLSFGSGAPSFASYAKFFDGAVYLATFGRTLRISVLVTLVCLLTGYPVGYLLARVGPVTLRVLTIAILVPL